jgi:hypothetical protein
MLRADKAGVQARGAGIVLEIDFPTRDHTLERT